jgi:hypothetical protein
MYVGVVTVEVTQRALKSIRFSLEKYERVSSMQAGNRAGQTKLERHVEARWRANAAQIVNGYFTPGDQAKDPVQPPRPYLSDFQHASRRAANRDDRRHQGDKLRFVAPVEWNVKKDRWAGP